MDDKRSELCSRAREVAGFTFFMAAICFFGTLFWTIQAPEEFNAFGTLLGVPMTGYFMFGAYRARQLWNMLEKEY